MCRNIIRIVNRPPEPMIIGPYITDPARDSDRSNATANSSAVHRR